MALAKAVTCRRAEVVNLAVRHLRSLLLRVSLRSPFFQPVTGIGSPTITQESHRWDWITKYGVKMQIQIPLYQLRQRRSVSAVPRTDKESGRELQALLEFHLQVDARAIRDALGYSSSRYYRRCKDDDYPNAEELRIIANRFGLNPIDLQVRFGLISEPDIEGYTGGPLATAPRKGVTKRPLAKLSRLQRRPDAPPF
jgi:hypothetical protein